MTAEPDLLPRPPLAECSEDSVQEWGRANVAHAIAPLQAEIEALRAEVDAFVADVEVLVQMRDTQHDRAERLAEALREIAHAEEGDSLIGQIARAALEQEKGRE